MAVLINLFSIIASISYLLFLIFILSQFQNYESGRGLVFAIYSAIVGIVLSVFSVILKKKSPKSKTVGNGKLLKINIAIGIIFSILIIDTLLNYGRLIQYIAFIILLATGHFKI